MGRGRWDVQPFQADAPSGQELSCLPVPVGTPGSLPVHYTVMDQPPQPSPFSVYSVHTWGFFPTPSLGAFLQTLEEYMSPAGPRGAVWASLPRQKNQTDFVTGSNTHTSNSTSPACVPQPQPPCWYKCQGLSLRERPLDSPQSDGRAAPRTGEVSDCTTCPQSLQGNNLGSERP